MTLHRYELLMGCTLWGDKVSMLTHIFPHKPLRKIEVTTACICKITRLTANFIMCSLMSDMLICKFIKSVVIHDTECPYWDQVSLNNTKPNFDRLYILNYTPMGVVIHNHLPRKPLISSYYNMFPTDHCRLVSIFRRKVRWHSEHVYTRITDTCRLT